jgi:hypothetical protein
VKLMMGGSIRIFVVVAAAALGLLLFAALGQAGGSPSLSWSPSTQGGFDFGTVGVGDNQSQTFTLTNSGGSASADLTVSVTGPETFTVTSDGCSGTSLGPNKSCTVTVEYAPTASGTSAPATLEAQGKKAAADTSLTLTGKALFEFTATGPNAPGLSSANENPPHPASSGTGTALITWDTTTNLMTVQVTFSGLSAGTTASHIHCCIAPPNNAGVATTVPTFTGFPLGGTSGTYTHTFNMLDPASYNPAFVAANGGTAASAEAVLFAGLQAGHAYLNIHTTAFPGGEIRGFLEPA